MILIRAVIETLLVLGLACGCAWAGYTISRRRSGLWLFCFCLSFLLIVLVVVLHRVPTLAYRPLFVWLSGHANAFIVMAAGVPFVFALLIPRLRIRRQKIFLTIFAGLITAYFIIPPFLDPALLYAAMADSDTWLEDDVCLQTTRYTCGAASAVTALKQFGIDAEEKEMAYAASTCRAWGTPVYTLAKAIEKTYADQGIVCTIKTFETVDELIENCPVIVVVKHRLMIDHYITVLEVGPDDVLVGDPLSGRERLPRAAFERTWRKIGIIVSKHSEADYLEQIQQEDSE